MKDCINLLEFLKSYCMNEKEFNLMQKRKINKNIIEIILDFCKLYKFKQIKFTFLIITLSS